jgi:predicted PurR-regulated permease PerM
MLRDTQGGNRLLLIAPAIVIIVWGISQAQSVIVVLLVSIFLAVIATTPVLWLERNRVPAFAAVLIVVTTMVMLLLVAGAVVGGSLNDFANALPMYQTRFHGMIGTMRAALAQRGIPITDEVLLGYVNPGAVMSLTTVLFTAMGSVLSNAVVIVFTMVFILLEAAGFPAKLRAVLENPQADFQRFTKFVVDIKRYVIIKTIINLIAGVMTTLWLFILGVDFPVLWGGLAFLLHFVPNIGSIVAAVPVILIALVQLGGGSAILTAAGYLVIGMLLGNIVEPRIMGHRLGMSPLVVFLSLIFWGNLLGLIGALLCVPLTLTLKLACETREDTRWIALLLGPALSPERIPPPTAVIT